ncbi:DUF3140 domain-containing protein [Paraburkholderia sp. MMS20-SJTR3]|uniref:DUF3140 domain-containing protein n=1 Tax=Paraburkholderia sejongensis TaxID=2886946 RepID=A0ABS8JMR9_9BURK|nr:DUF3140 domain-containing protein [Paraburkholderia sp. MMS20-SJTR3]MCC8391195.1 DUF3140 domain-containing protein [Paraburkholderia sp. MMS20-SJTR3]
MTHADSSSDKSDHDVVTEFKRQVNMSASELARWLDTDASREVGQKHDGGESVGHRSGRRIVQLLGTRQNELSEDDIRHMRKVLGYIARHLAQRPAHPAAELEQTAWRYSLMNWGHDPLKHR